MSDFSQADITEMRKRGGLRAFLRQQSRPTRTPEPTTDPEPERAPDRRPGAWPAGTRPPAPPTPAPGADWTTALADYRRWSAAADRTEDHTHYRCECGTCPREDR